MAIGNTCFQHIGKAGGGSVKESIRASPFYTILKTNPCAQTTDPTAVSVCHIKSNICTGILNVTNVLVNVREPVDRFVSAFDWRMSILCQPGDVRKPGLRTSYESIQKHPCQGCGDTMLYCKKGIEHEESILLKYGKDANELAESLCARGIKKAGEARSDLAQIGHAKYSLTEKLGGRKILWAKLGSRSSIQLTAIPLEPGFNFTEAIADAMRMVLTPPVPHKTRKSADGMELQVLDSDKHSSVALKAALGLRKSKLSKTGADCVAQHYAADYETIGRLADIGCRGPRAANCKAALHSMIARRNIKIPK